MMATFLNEMTLYSEDGHLRQRALIGIRTLLRHDFYSRSIILGSFSDTILVSDQTMQALISAAERDYGPKYCGYLTTVSRHCNEGGGLVHIMSSAFFGSPCSEDCALEHHLRYDINSVLSIRFDTGNAVKLPNSLVPILAGHFQDGRTAYLARANHVGEGFPSYCCICENMKPEDLRVWDPLDKKFRIPSAVNVFVLRYEPEVYTDEYGEVINTDKAELMDKTGPYGWSVERELPRISEVFGS